MYENSETMINIRKLEADLWESAQLNRKANTLMDEIQKGWEELK